ncbi:type VII secretion protein EsaA [Neobacillus drentensis]|uniref:type VII secretion protein EsaA n=1 Tax=Neobacillus drentensis TaxID=220684 RepID=UPI001F37575B|nr:type VII secretion protein EsaA [Neobacillus drentensis]ULT57352.1 type VII secretion protein EsaA [Neobacillus drentensis]
MKKMERSVLLFLIFVLVLASGITYLALNQASKSKDNEDDPKMTVALVNEDQGAEFNGDNYQFGNEFIKNIEKDDQQDWFVVSRGVAENGLKRNVYNMVIVIPNDFTKKALSIESKTPEQVVVNYKINATDNSNLKAAAEKTASSILGEFNRRIIDVYFASVLGNLHEAQDNIGTLVQKEQFYTNVYNNSVHRPLAGYTSQFGAVQTNTKVSKDSFQGLQNLLKGFENNIGQGVQTGNIYQSSFKDFTNLQAANALDSKGFSEQLMALDSQMNDGSVLQQLEGLMAANKAINEQFHTNEDQSANILSEAAALQSYLTNTKAEIEKADTELADKLAADMQTSIRDQVLKEIKNSSDGEHTVNLSGFFAQPDVTARNAIQRQINQLPSLNPEDLIGLPLKDETITQLKNVMAFTNKYNREFNFNPNRNSDSIPLADQVERIKNSLINDGVVLTDTVTLPEDKKDGQEFTLSIPKEFSVTQVILALPNSNEMGYTEPFAANNKINLPKTEEGSFTVKVKVKLKEADKKVDVFQPITWNWNLEQKDVTAVDTPITPEISETSEQNQTTTEQSSDTAEPTNNIAATESGNLMPQIDAASLKNTDTPSTGETGTENQDHTAIPDEANNNQSNDPSNSIIKIKIVNNHITHQVMSPLITDSSNVLVNSSSATISDYQKLMSLYNLYFGIGSDQFNRPDLVDQLDQSSLSDIASEDSLYYLFNKQDIVDILANYVAEQTTEEMKQQTEEWKSKMDTYLSLVNDANDHSMQMADKINQTIAQAELQNTTLTKTLEDLSKWRGESLNLQDAQSKILLNGNEEQSVVVSLDSQLGSLLESSLLLADQSKNNLNSADHVYQTFETIDHQAKNIQASGANLVKQADDLSTNLTDKTLKDKNFAANFAGVLANSRIGERPNENLLNFLSKPVQTKNAGLMMASDDTFTPYFVVLICFIVSLFTAYVLANHERKRLNNDSFAEEQTLVRQNTPMTIITASIGLVEGLVIGLLSGYFLEINEGKFLLWVAMITLIMAAMLLASTYLLRQLKMAGMFVLLVILSLYLFLTDAIGLHFDPSSFAAQLRDYSPLQYIETWLMKFGSGAAGSRTLIFSLVAVTVMSLVGHLFVTHRFGKNEEVIHEGVSESL